MGVDVAGGADLAGGSLAGRGGPARLGGGFVAAVCAVYLAGWLGLAVVASGFQAGREVSLWYPPSGLSFALLLLFGLRYVPVLFATDVLAKFAGITPDASWVDAASRAGWTTLVYAAAAAVLLRRARIDPRLLTQRDVSWFLAVGCVLAPAVAAAGQVLQYDLSGLLRWSDGVTNTAAFWSGSATGIGMLTPVLLVASRRLRVLVPGLSPSPPQPPISSPRGWESLGQAVLLAATVVFAYGGRVERSLDFAYLVYLPLIWIAVRAGFTRTVFAVFTANIAAVALVGPAAAEHPLRLQLGLVSLTLASLMLGAVASQRHADAVHAAGAALRDPLTDLSTRAVLVDRLTAAVARRSREPGPLAAVLACDLDSFRTVNDGLGHDAGDRVLVAVAHRIQRTCGPGTLTARLGGDQIAVLIDHPADVEEAQEVGSRLVDALHQPFTDEGRDITITASVGIALLRGSRPPNSAAALHPGGSVPAATADPGEEAEQLLRAADTAVRHAKTRGGDRWELSTEPLRERGRQQLRRRAALRRAVTDNTVEVVYQPIVALPSRRTVTVEALARWSDPPGTPVAPAEFIDLAERTGLIHDLGLHILDRACEDLARWRAGPAPQLRVAVNVSPRQLVIDTFPGDVLQVLRRHRLPPDALDLEITESSALDQSGPTRTVLQRLTAAGVALVIDDFGTGYSSFSVLHDLPFTGLKIDQSFTARLPDARTTAVVEAIIAMAAHLQLQVTVEGVETPEQLHQLESLGCHYAQGVLLARPGPPRNEPPASA